jgi:hypothetical protein
MLKNFGKNKKNVKNVKIVGKIKNVVELCILYTEKGACTPDKDGQK